MNRTTILSIALSLVLIVCLFFVLRSCMADRAVSEPVIYPAQTVAPVRVPTPKPAPTPTPTPEPEPEEEPEEELPFALARQLEFGEPEEHSIPAVQAASLPEAVCSPIRALVSPPFITFTGPDDEGFIIYEISYSTTVDTHFTMPADKSVDAFYVLIKGYDLFDYDTGRMLSSGAGPDTGEARASTRETELASEEGSFTVTVTEDTDCSWDKWQFTQDGERVAAVGRAVVKTVLTVRAPEDYTGLVLGLDLNNAQRVPAKLFSGEAQLPENPEFWDGDPADWTFLLADDWIGYEPFTEEEAEPEQTDEEVWPEEDPEWSDAEEEDPEDPVFIVPLEEDPESAL